MTSQFVSFLPLSLTGRRAIVVSCVCPSVCPSVSTVTAITFEGPFLFAPNLVVMHKLGRSKHLLKMDDLDLHLQGHLCKKIVKIWLFSGSYLSLLRPSVPYRHSAQWHRANKTKQWHTHVGDTTLSYVYPNQRLMEVSSFWFEFMGQGIDGNKFDWLIEWLIDWLIGVYDVFILCPSCFSSPHPHISYVHHLFVHPCHVIRETHEMQCF